MMDPIIKEKWVKALRGGEYQQGRNRFFSDDAFCCFAVGYHVLNPGADMTMHTTLDGVHALGLSYKQKDALIVMNDEEGKSFAEIADYIEEYL